MIFDFNRRNVGDIVIEKINVFRLAEKEAKEFQKRLDDDLKNGYKKLIIDLSSVEFANSTFLGVLVVLLKKINDVGGEIKIVLPKEPTRAYFINSGLNRVFNLYRNSEEALESFNI